MGANTSQLQYNTTPNTIYGAPSDFQKVDPALKRMIVVGCTGMGKSFVLNCLGGFRYIQREDGGDYRWEKVSKDMKEPSIVSAALFEASDSARSCTDKTSYAILNWLGIESDDKTFVAVDTPGLDDTGKGDDFKNNKDAQEKVRKLSIDFSDKIKSLGTLNAIMIVNKVQNKALSPALVQVLEMVDQRFKEADPSRSIWEHVIMAFTHCDHLGDDTWKVPKGKEDKTTKEMQNELKQKFPSCKVDVPCVFLGGADRIIESNNTMKKTDDYFDKLWTVFKDMKSISTQNIKPFKGVEEELVKEIEEGKWKDEKLEALGSVYWVVGVILMLILFFWFRSVLPGFLRFCLADVLQTSCIDELCIVAFIVWNVIGFTKMMATCCILYEKAGPHLKPEQLKEKFAKSQTDKKND